MARPHWHGTSASLARLTLVACTVIGLGSHRADAADPPAGPKAAQGEPTSHQAKADAQKHFQKAQELYQEGSYREAIAELEAAVLLDPKAKDLYFNLGVVDEKLGRIDEALERFKQYATFDLDPQERSRVDKYIRRLEGAKMQLASQPAPVFMPAPGTAPAPPPPPKQEEKIPNGRIDAATITAASVCVIGLGVGTVLAVQASGSKPEPGFVTGRDGTYAELEEQAKSAHRQAIMADVGFGIGVLAGAAAAYLYFARPRVTSAPSTSAQVSAAPLSGGGAVVVGGRF